MARNATIAVRLPRLLVRMAAAEAERRRLDPPNPAKRRTPGVAQTIRELIGERLVQLAHLHAPGRERRC